MSEQLLEVKKKLEDAEAEFLAYKQDAKLFSVEGKQNINVQKIQDFNTAYLETRNQRLTLEARLAELKKTLNRKGNLLHARSLIEK